MSGFVSTTFAHLRICQRRSDLRVPVVDRRLDALHAELAERARLVLRECLRRIEVQRPALRLAGEQVENGQVEGEALPARGARRHDRVAAGTECFPRLGLMRVEPRDPLRDESRGDARVEVVRELLGSAGPRGLDREVRELCSLEELEPGRRDDTHKPYASLRPTGVPSRAENTPVEPDPVRTGEGRAERSACVDDCDVRFRRRSRDPGRPEGVRGRAAATGCLRSSRSRPRTRPR